MAVCSDLEGITERLESQNNAMKNMECGSSWISSIPKFKSNLFENREIAQEIKEQIKESSEPSWEYVRSLKERIEFLERRVAQLEHLAYSLQTGQIAFDFEKDLATYIYPNGKKFGSRKVFTTMKEWLERKKDTPQGGEANRKWNELQKEFSWSDDHEKMFSKLLEFRRKFAHPPVDRKAIKTQIPDDFTYEEKILIQDIISMTDKVNELMKED